MFTAQSVCDEIKVTGRNKGDANLYSKLPVNLDLRTYKSIVFDRGARKCALETNRRLDGDRYHRTLVLIDLQTGAYHNLVADDQINSKRDRGFSLLGFTGDGAYVVYKFGEVLFHVRTSDGRILATSSEDLPSRPTFSPSGMRLLCDRRNRHSQTDDYLIFPNQVASFPMPIRSNGSTTTI